MSEPWVKGVMDDYVAEAEAGYPLEKLVRRPLDTEYVDVVESTTEDIDPVESLRGECNE